MRVSFGTERSLSLFGLRAQPMQARGFSYTTLVDPDFADGVQMYQADDLAFSGTPRPANYLQAQEHREPCGGDVGVGNGHRGQARRTSDDCWSSITALDIKRSIWGADVFGTDADLRVIDDEDIPRIEGRARKLRRRAHQKVASALERARDGWETFIFSLSQIKRRGGVVPGPCLY
ncbi:hypothetical protein LPJ71_005591 [Coemansia sp. S17]|nr:hypothetical protein LPJ71_005591 [Coemansia sp. S17]